MRKLNSICFLLLANLHASAVFAANQNMQFAVGGGRDSQYGYYSELGWHPPLSGLRTTGAIAAASSRVRWLHLDLRYYPEKRLTRIKRLELINLHQVIDHRSDEISTPSEFDLMFEDPHTCYDDPKCYRSRMRAGIGMGRGFSQWPQALRAMLIVEVGSSREFKNSVYTGPGMRIVWETTPNPQMNIDVNYEVVQRTQRELFTIERVLSSKITYDWSDNWRTHLTGRLVNDYKDITLTATHTM